MIFQLFDCDIGLKLGGTNYQFGHVEEVTIDDPEETTLTRGSNGTDTDGLAYTDGLNEPKTITIPTMNMPIELYNLLVAAHKNKTRMDFYAVSRRDGSRKSATSALLSKKPQQLTIGNSAESMQVQLVLKSFNTDEVHKS